jgi:hypothetical protein
MKRKFSKEDIQMVYRRMKKYSKALITGEYILKPQ